MSPSENKYLYNGKELEDEQLGGVNLDWYDYGGEILYLPILDCSAAHFDAYIGRHRTFAS